MERKGKNPEAHIKAERQIESYLNASAKFYAMKKKIPKNECPECGSNNVYYDKEKDEIVCRDCGAIFAELTPKEEKEFEGARGQR